MAGETVGWAALQLHPRRMFPIRNVQFPPPTGAGNEKWPAPEGTGHFLLWS
jgi:hypothetical protein